MLAGSAVLVFAMDTQWGVPYFLLGREQCVRGWKGSGKWSDFGGSVGKKESAECCAAREFQEETMGVVRWKFSERVPRQSSSNVAVSLAAKEYLFRLNITCTQGRVYTCFVKQIPWQPSVARRFRRTRRAVVERTAVDHPATTSTLRKRRAYLEKTDLKWWSIYQLRRAVKSGRLLSGDYSPEKLGTNFRARLECVIREFPAVRRRDILKCSAPIDCETYKSRMRVFEETRHVARSPSDADTRGADKDNGQQNADEATVCSTGRDRNIGEVRVRMQTTLQRPPVRRDGTADKAHGRQGSNPIETAQTELCDTQHCS